MDTMSKFIQRENISRFAQALHEDGDPERRMVLNRLLLAEEDRFGYYSELLTLASDYIVSGTTRVDRQKAVVEQGRAHGQDVTADEKLLANMVETLETFRRFQDRVRSQME